jgi:2',3'-cyclic-nucleotide 2'-phosphodiesterase (5'-nucleotidase family)
MPALSGYLALYRQRFANSIYLDAGDLMTGNPICNIEYGGVKGGALLEMLRRIGVDAMSLGNHEFDQGPDHVRDFVTVSPFPILCANLRDKSTGRLLAAPTRIFERGGERIGVIGLILNGLADVTARKNVEQFQVEDITKIAQEQIDRLDPLTDLIVLLTHNGVDEDRELASVIHNADVIVGGHSHTRLDGPERVNGVLIVQAGSYCNNLGMLELTVAGDSVTSCKGRLIELLADSVSPMPEVASLADSLEAVIELEYGATIGQLTIPWIHKYYECSNVGSWICDRLRKRYGTDVALMNAGGIRADLAPGPISKLDVLKLLPFMNSVVTFETTGAQLLQTARKQAEAHGLHSHGVLEMSGLTITYRKHGDQIEVTETIINGSPIQPDRTYTVVSIDYVASSQPDRYLRFKPRILNYTGELISDVITSEIQNSPHPIESDNTIRLQEIH